MSTPRNLDPDVDLLAMHAAWPDRYPFLLQSVGGDGTRNRYDILFAAPGETLRLEADGRLTGPHAGSGFLASLDRWWQAERGPDAGAPGRPFNGGWFLFLGYELAGEIEPGLRLPGGGTLPVALATRVRAAVIRDRASGRMTVVAEADASGMDERIREDAAAAPPLEDDGRPALSGRTREEPPGRYLRAVRTAKTRIAAGQIYQANLSRLWRGTRARGVSPAVIYRRLCAANPGPFAGLMRIGDQAVISSSPERLLEIRRGRASTRPIAGTRPRGRTGRDDAELSSELIAHPKERAEHVMLIDLERNDLGRICRPGTVTVDEMMTIESYRHVHHIVSNVSGEIREGVTPGEAIAAVFPGGTITGCPKVRCMEIIAELEAEPREAYTGSFGYLNRDGSLDLNILIRTVIVDGRALTLRAGAGIVADSVPEQELAETRAKAKGLLLALGQATGE